MKAPVNLSIQDPSDVDALIAAGITTPGRARLSMSSLGPVFITNVHIHFGAIKVLVAADTHSAPEVPAPLIAAMDTFNDNPEQGWRELLECMLEAQEENVESERELLAEKAARLADTRARLLP